MRPHDNWLHHLINKKMVLGPEVSNIEGRRGNSGVIGMTLEIDEFHVFRLKIFFNSFDEVPKLARISRRLPGIEFLENPGK